MVFAFAAGSRPSDASAEAGQRVEQADRVTVMTVFDNYAVDPALTARWGFASVVISSSGTVLFDTGSEANVLLSNMERMGLAPGDVSKVVISHAHMDHLGGLAGFLEQIPNVTVYIPSSFPDAVRRDIRAARAEYRDVDGPLEVAEGMHATGGLNGGLPEQALVIDTADGLVILTGCAHPGIVAIVQRAKEIVPDRPTTLVMGGFHLMSASAAEIDRIIRNFQQMGVERVAPSHCSGDRARELFSRQYGKDYIEGGAGNVMIFD
jgi:7,8-dihydropterin-6-yl-methyl-4-(beta-D-ribofuranosyl)aminobenzene 5'-phosphate synthase